MKKSVVFYLLMHLGKTSWSQNIMSVTKPINLETNINVSQINGTDHRRKNPEELMKLFKGKSNKLDNKDYYEPYHEGGERVYLWTTRQPPQIHKDQKTVSPSSQAPYTFEQTNNEMQIYRDCDRDCPGVFQDFYGIVCGFRFNTKTYKYEYREFNDLCELEYFNCKYPEARPMWQVIHRGPCPELTSFRPFPNNTAKIVDRAQSWLNRNFNLASTKKH